MDKMEWLEISLRIDPEVAEAVADVLSRYAPGGVAYEQNALDLTGEEWRPDGPLEPKVTIRAYLPAGPETNAKRRQIEEALWHLGQIRSLPAPQFRTVAEEQWADAWKEHFHVTRIGRRFVIKPSWREYTPSPLTPLPEGEGNTEVVIELDPGQAFGTGLHPTTQMCLQAIEEHLRPGDTVLDLGTGSGILAIAAAKLGASHVLALDIDPVAVQAAQANIDANGTSQVVTVTQGSLKEIADFKFQISDSLPTSNFQLVIVNILAKVIVELCDQGLGQVAAPGGKAIFAGLIDTQEAEVRAGLARAGLEVIHRLQEKDWVGLVCRRQGKEA
jgi:ribosomal protein L11 methyltransferase